jgi:hypothetical protein
MIHVFKPFRTALIGCFALLQVALLPATYVVHIGCDHDHLVVEPSESCHHHGHSHCDQHATDDSKQDDTPVHHHDSDKCLVCQVAFAAQLAGVDAPDLSTSDLTEAADASAVTFPCADVRYAMPVRGPPAA